MSDNRMAFETGEYEQKIKQTIPYYEEFYEQIIQLVELHNGAGDLLTWLDIGCGTGKMAEVAFKCRKIQKFVFCDCSSRMIEIVKERFGRKNTEFLVCESKDLIYYNEFDVITAIQVNHYLQKEEREEVIRKCYQALKKDGLFITFENFAPFTEYGKNIYLEKWKKYQIHEGISVKETENHIKRYGKEYYPISLPEHIELLQRCGFRTVEMLWISNMQAGIWGLK